MPAFVRAQGPFTAIAVAAFAVSLAAPLLPRAPFASYFGPVPAPLAILGVAGLGLFAVTRLQSIGWTARRERPAVQVLRFFALGAACALPTVALDIALPFPAGINVPLPDALAFYPAIGLVAETVFHLLPFALLSLILPARPGLAIIACAMVEPVFQVTAGGGLDLRNAIMAVMLFGFGLVQMTAFRRHGFAAAYALRIGYYAVWHIGWGAARGPVLFGS